MANIIDLLIFLKIMKTKPKQQHNVIYKFN